MLLVSSILEWPARFADSRVVSGRGNTFDILPTILDALEIPITESPILDGESLLPRIQGKPINGGKRWDSGMRNKEESRHPVRVGCRI